MYINEYYMVHDDLWEEAAQSDIDEMLCIPCLEKRIGRLLNPEDFTEFPINTMMNKNPLAQHRMGKSALTGEQASRTRFQGLEIPNDYDLKYIGETSEKYIPVLDIASEYYSYEERYWLMREFLVFNNIPQWSLFRILPDKDNAAFTLLYSKPSMGSITVGVRHNESSLMIINTHGEAVYYGCSLKNKCSIIGINISSYLRENETSLGGQIW